MGSVNGGKFATSFLGVEQLPSVTPAPTSSQTHDPEVLKKRREQLKGWLEDAQTASRQLHEQLSREMMDASGDPADHASAVGGRSDLRHHDAEAAVRCVILKRDIDWLGGDFTIKVKEGNKWVNQPVPAGHCVVCLGVIPLERIVECAPECIRYCNSDSCQEQKDFERRSLLRSHLAGN